MPGKENRHENSVKTVSHACLLTANPYTERYSCLILWNNCTKLGVVGQVLFIVSVGFAVFGVVK